MARRIETTRPAPFRAPRIPQAGRLRRITEREGLELRPLAGPEIPLPPDQDQTLQDKWQAWNATIGGSLPEFIVWDWLVNTKKQKEGLDFVYQWPIFGGRTAFGGFVIDFIFPLQQMGWNVQGLRWHTSNPDDRARDMIAKQMLASRGLKIIDLYEDDLLTRPTLVLEGAWRGEQVNTSRER